MVHIEELFAAFQIFQSAQRAAIKYIREPKQFDICMKAAQDVFEKFCNEHALPVDFSKRL